MRVFCPEHKKGFFAPRQSPIKCENRGHLLGEIDFEGQARTPVELQWQYCCNCEHFCPVDFDQYGLQRCPVCTRRSSLLYLCDRCHVISFESNTPLQTKNFTLNAEGAPQPSCPGCLRPASADLHEHTCDELNISFITGLSSCPACEERLDIAPAFPSLVAPYLKRTRSANKVNVTFDYETGVFVPVEDGEFVVVTHVDDAIVLPRTTRFTNKRDFYEFYQDYYHCPNPDAGEVQIVQPASVARTENGWALESTGVLEVVREQPKKQTVAPAVQPPVAPVVRAPVVPQRPEVERPIVKDVVKEASKEPTLEVVREQEQPEGRACPDCGSLIEAKYSFCWKCGAALGSDRRPSGSNIRKPGTLIASGSMDLDDDDELTMHHESQPMRSNMLPWTTPNRTEHPSSSRGSVLKLISIGAVALTLVGLGAFGLLRSDTPTVSSAPPVQQQPAVETSQTSQPVPPPTAITTEVSRSAPAETTTQQRPAVSPDDELKKLREQRITARASERRTIIQAIAKVEKQYPRDYRFPYERAKLAVKSALSSSRSEAFKALNTAAQKAISTGKAGEMLNGLENDKSGDFSRLSQGRDQWTRLVAALKRRDTSLLNE